MFLSSPGSYLTVSPPFQGSCSAVASCRTPGRSLALMGRQNHSSGREPSITHSQEHKHNKLATKTGKCTELKLHA